MNQRNRTSVPFHSDVMMWEPVKRFYVILYML
jgi:hypothetical protein